MNSSICRNFAAFSCAVGPVDVRSPRTFVQDGPPSAAYLLVGRHPQSLAKIFLVQMRDSPVLGSSIIAFNDNSRLAQEFSVFDLRRWDAEF